MKGTSIVLVALALATTACKGDSTSSTPTTPTTKTDTFNGTVPVGGSSINNFTATDSGQVSVTLTAAGPPATIPMGVGVGTPGTGACGVLPGASVTTGAGATAQLTGLVSAGTLCVTVYDVGNQTAAVTYSLTVVHP